MGSSRLKIILLWTSLFFSQGLAQNLMDGVASSCTYFYNETDPTLVLKSPGFDDGNYPNNIKCAWTIESPEQAAGITIRFKYFDLEPTKRCSKYDYVMLYAQGYGESTWKQLGASFGYCGFHESINITETTKRVLIIFKSDDTRTFKGFNATFNIQITQAKPQILCLSLLENTKSGGSCNRTIEVEEYSVFLVQCVTRAIPPATYKWQKRHPTNLTQWIDIRPEIVKNVFPNGSIQLHDVRKEDKADYRCHAKNKHGEDDETFSLYVKQKCLCPKNIRMSWYQYPPYTKYQAGTDRDNNAIYKGIFYVVLAKMIDAVCGTCEDGHGSSTLIWDDPKNLKKRLTDVKKEIEGEGVAQEDIPDIFFPIEGGKLDDKYRNIYYFIPVVDSPGVAFMVPGIEEGASAMAIFDSVMQGKPILILTVIMAVLAGIIMWMLDTYWNEEQFPRKFGEGIIEGFWWAFVTMTTVGYGDIAPVGVPGRLFAIVWILTGLVIIAIFTGVITTSLTVVALSSNVKLYGTKVGAMANTAEYRMGVIKNAEMTDATTFEDLSYKLGSRSIEGALLDSYVAAYHRDKFGKFRVNNIFTSLKAFGIVLGPKLSSQMLYNRFKNYIEENKASITTDVEQNTDTLAEPGQSAAEEASSDLFNPSSKLFVQCLTYSCVFFGIFAVLGFSFDRFYLQPRSRMIESAKNLEMIESEEIKEMARRSKLLTNVLLHEVQSFYDSWSDVLGSLTRKHKAQQAKLLQKGPPCKPQPIIPTASAPSAEEAIEMENTETAVDESKGYSRPSTRSSNKSTTFLVRSADDNDDDDNNNFDDSQGGSGGFGAQSAVSIRSGTSAAPQNQEDSGFGAKSAISLKSATSTAQTPAPQTPTPQTPAPQTPTPQEPTPRKSPPTTPTPPSGPPDNGKGSPLNQGSSVSLVNNQEETDL